MMKTNLTAHVAATALLAVQALALDEVKATRHGVSSRGDDSGLHDLQFGVMVRGKLDEKIGKLERELRLLTFQKDVFPLLAAEITYSGSRKTMAECTAELSQKVGGAIPLHLGDYNFVVGLFSFEAIPLVDALKYLAAFGNCVLDVDGKQLVCVPVANVPGQPRGEPGIVQLIRDGDLGQVFRALAQEKGDISSVTDSSGKNLLHHAVWQNQIEIAGLLFDRGIDVNACDDTGITPLHQAVRMRRWRMIPLLLEKGADPSIRDNWHNTPIETALHDGEAGVARQMYKTDYPLDVFTAAGLGLADKVKAYLDEGVQWTVRFEDYFPDGVALVTRASDPRGRSPGSYMGVFNNSPLHWAAVGGSVEVAKLLIARGIPVEAANSHGERALHWAARGGNAEVVGLLISTNQDVAAVDIGNKTPLHSAAESGRLEAARVLIAHGADVNAVTTPWKSTPLLLVARMADNPELVRLLVEAGADVNAVDSRKENALHMIAHFGAPHTPATAQILIDAGASLVARNADKQTPLEAALSAVSCHGNQELVSVMRKAEQSRSSRERKEKSQQPARGDGEPAPQP